MNWNEKLFFKINSLVGKNRWLDAFGRAGAEWVIVAMAGWYATVSFVLHFGNIRAMWTPIISLGVCGATSWLISGLVGMIFKEVRPRLKFPEIKILFWPLYNTKSFPSDHTMFAFLIAFFALIFNFPTAWSLLLLAVWVAWGRVYAGLHYPRDVVGGIILAITMTVASCYIMLFNGTFLLF